MRGFYHLSIFVFQLRPLTLTVNLLNTSLTVTFIFEKFFKLLKKVLEIMDY